MSGVLGKGEDAKHTKYGCWALLAEIKRERGHCMENQDLSREERLENLFIAARNARETSDEETAIKHYEAISTLAPNNWEALFYLVVLKTKNIKYGEISNAAISVSNCLPKVFELINTTIDDEQKKKEAVAEVEEQCGETAGWLVRASGNFYNNITQNDPDFSLITLAVRMDAKRHARYESAQRAVFIGNMLRVCGDCIESVFGLEDTFYQELAVDCWEAMMLLHTGHIKQYKVAVFNDETVKLICDKIRRYDASFEMPKIKATEKRDYAVKLILMVLAGLAVGVLGYLWLWSADLVW